MIVPFRQPGDRNKGTPVQSTLWYRAFLSGEEVAAGHLAVMCEQFALAVRKAGEPDGACLFAIREDAASAGSGDADTDGTTALFFSPRAIALVPLLLVGCGARPSNAPQRLNATLLVGRASDWSLLPHSAH